MSASNTRQPRVAEWLLIGDAIERILAAVPPLPTEHVPLLEAGGRVLAVPAISALTLPPWDNSGMDGYAVRSVDVGSATRDAPVALRVTGGVVAGGFPDREVGPGEAYRIMTGAPIPSGADTVIRVEHTRVVSSDSGDIVEILDTMDLRKNIRFMGEDLSAGETVLQPGIVLRPAEIGVLASIGMSHPDVTRRPRVAILSTGDELVDLDGLDEAIAGRRIINSNSYLLAAGVRATGGEPVVLGIARDDAADLRAKLHGALDCDVLITTAGASVGEHDLVKDALEGIGMQVEFWRVKMRPGSPFSFGVIRRPGMPDLPVFGLPGNPVSAVVTFEVLVRPALRRMQGRRFVYPRVIQVQPAEPIESKPGMTHFLRVTLSRRASDGALVATLTGPQGSGILTSVARADALLVVPLDVTEIPAGSSAAAVLLQAGDEAQDTLGF